MEIGTCTNSSIYHFKNQLSIHPYHCNIKSEILLPWVITWNIKGALQQDTYCAVTKISNDHKHSEIDAIYNIKHCDQWEKIKK